MKTTFFLTIFFLLHFAGFSNYWQPYPINVVIGVNGTQQRLELSVWDSLMGSWQYYNSPYFNAVIDSTGSSQEIIVFKAADEYGYIIYDPVLHQFAPIFQSYTGNGAYTFVWVLDNVVAISKSCCVLTTSNGTFSSDSYEAYIYDINLNSWRGGEMIDGDAIQECWISMNLQPAGLLFTRYNDYDYNPSSAANFYSPHIGSFTGIGFTTYYNSPMSGNQDQLFSVLDNMLTSNISSINVYNPLLGNFPGFLRSDIGDTYVDGGLVYESYPNTDLRYFAIFDDYTHSWKIDTIFNDVTTVRIKNRVGAYADSTVVPTTIHFQVFSPTLHDWVKDSAISVNGLSTLSILDGTVHWTDTLLIPGKAGYNDSIGWGNFDTPLQPFFQVTDMFPVMGKPLIFVRDYSIGSDSAFFDFGDGTSTTYSQGSAWHQFKVNGSYSLISNPANQVCINSMNSQMTMVACQTLTFNTILVGGTTAATNVFICPGDSSIISSTGYNGPLQWQFKTTGNLWMDVSGPAGTNDSLVVFPLTDTYYRIKVSNGIDAPAYSDVSFVKVVSPSQPSSIIGSSLFCYGEHAIFSVDSLPGVVSFAWNLPASWIGSSTSFFIDAIAGPVGGVVTADITNICGITSSVVVPVNVITIDTSLTLNSNTLWASMDEDSSTFSWIDCVTGIEVGTYSSFEPQITGSYAVIINYNGCVDTSSCWDFDFTGIENINSLGNLSVFPNPTNKSITVQGDGMKTGSYELKLVDVYGQILLQKNYVCTATTLNTQLDISEFSSGIYFLYAESKDYSRILRITKH